MAILSNDWAPHLEEEFQKPYYRQLRSFLVDQYNKTKVYPDMRDIYNALHYTPYQDV